MSPIGVLDASVVARFWFSEQDVELADAAYAFLRARAEGRIELHAPDLMLVEVGNALWKMARFQGWPLAAARSAASQLPGLGFELHPAERDLVAAVDIALDHGVTVYDALYVSLARRLGAPLYTTDQRLVRSVGRDFPEVRPLTA
jgi:predicted nucleic acid-binding protein